MQRLKAPETKFKSIDDIRKFNMMWNVSVVLLPIFLILLLIHFYRDDDSMTTSAAGLGVAVFNIFALYKTRKYSVIGILSVVFGTVICQGRIVELAVRLPFHPPHAHARSAVVPAQKTKPPTPVGAGGLFVVAAIATRSSRPTGRFARSRRAPVPEYRLLH